MSDISDEPATSTDDRPRKRPSRKAIAAACAAIVTAAIATAVATNSTDDAQPAATSTTAKPSPSTSLPPLAPASTSVTTKPQAVASKVGADVTYGGLKFTNTDKDNAIKITGVKPHVVGGDDTQVNVADVVLVYPMPEKPTELEKGWPPKAYPPENVFYAPGTFDLAPGETTQILLRLARTVKTAVKIDGFDVTYTIGDKEYVATVDNALTIDS